MYLGGQIILHGRRRVFHDDREFVSAEPANIPFVFKVLDQRIGHPYQHSVARVVTVGVVDAFEIVKVND